MKEKNNKVVYIHRKATDGTIFYVGMGSPKRPYIKSKGRRSFWWLKTFNKHGRVVEVVADGLSKDAAYELEMFLIFTIGRRDKGLGSLVNLDDGGGGCNGYRMSEDIKASRSRKVINTETLEVLPSGIELNRRYKIGRRALVSSHPNCDWMYLEDYNNEKHLTEKWINRYKIGLNHNVKLINTETLEVFYSITKASDSIGMKLGTFRTKLTGRLSNNTDIMMYEDYENGVHLTSNWKDRKIKTRKHLRKLVKIYDFKEQVWLETSCAEFKLKYGSTVVKNNIFHRGRFCVKGCEGFDENNNKWKNILDLKTGNIERFNRSHLVNESKISAENVSSLFRSRCKVLGKRYKIVE